MTPDKGHYIADLPRSGQVQLQAAVQSVSVKQKKDGSDYLSLTLVDKTGSIEAKIWDEADKAAPLCKPDSIINVAGVVDIYKDQLRLTIKRLLVTGPYELSDFIPASKYDREEMLSGLRQYIDTVRDEHIKFLLFSVVDHHAEELLNAPAAKKFHHAWAGGLLEHILSMCRAAHLLCRHYSDVNRDQVIAGAVLHDMGKLQELKVGLTFDYTAVGNLVGHVGLGLLLIENYAHPDMSAESKLRLMHLVASHHGDIEKGALKLPATLEALVLSAIDDLDAKIDQARTMLAKGDGEFTEKSYPLGRAIYRGEVKVREMEAVTSGN